MEQEKPEWVRLMAGGFAFMTAPFAMHPLDRGRAKKSVDLAKKAGVTRDEYISAARQYLQSAQGWPTNVDEQLVNVRKFIGSKLE